MSNYWKSKVLPKIKKFLDKGKKKGAAEACKSFDKTKESLDKEFEEKGADLNPKVVEIYRSSSTFITKKLLKEPNEATVKGNPDAVQSVLQELVKAGFPGAQVICDAGTKFGPALLPSPVVYLFEKASVYLVEEELPEEPKQDVQVETREMKVEDAKPAAEEGTDIAEATREAPKETDQSAGAAAASPEPAVPTATAEAETVAVAEKTKEDVPPEAAATAEPTTETTAAPAADLPAPPAAAAAAAR